jgi:hypothetical protein
MYLSYYLASNQNGDIVNKVANTLKGFFRVATVKGEESLLLYGDDRENPITYSGEFTSQSIVTFVLNQLDKIIEERAKVAKDLKAFQ